MDKSPAGLKRWAASHLRWYGQSAFRLRTEAGQSIFLDRTSIEGLRIGRTPLVLPRSCAEPGWNAIAAGETARIGVASITAVPAYNVRSRFHPSARKWLGYIVEVEGVHPRDERPSSRHRQQRRNGPRAPWKLPCASRCTSG